MSWDPDFTTRNPILGQLSDLIRFQQPRWPDVACLNKQLAAQLPVRFIDDQHFAALDCYYEEAVARGQVPTRQANWHDFFGAVIWYLFPHTKALLNRLHMEHIAVHGARRRTPRRDRITHFDECGLVLAVREGDEAAALLQAHDWQTLFVTGRTHWQQRRAFVFGHALYELALAPFIGLTAKAVVITMPDAFFEAPVHRQYQLLDSALCRQCEQQQLFDKPKPLRPLPLLGIPGWWPANENPAFYNNTDYFRPRRQG